MNRHAFLRLCLAGGWLLVCGASRIGAQSTDDLMFIHHSSGQNWLDDGLRDVLIAKPYIDEVNEITYGDVVAPDAGRAASLGGVAGDNTDMWHWILWFNDYLERVRSHGCQDGVNRIIIFKSCFTMAALTEDGTEPGDPFLDQLTLANFRSVFRNPAGAGTTYTLNEASYWPLGDIFARHPNVLFIAVISPPRVPVETCNNWADRYRVFANWLKNDWLSAYNAAHPGLNNVAVFDWFDVLAYPANYAGTETYDPANDDLEGVYPVRNMTRTEYRTGDSHPNTQANTDSTAAFATAPSNFIDGAFANWNGNVIRTAARRWQLLR